MAAPKSPRPRPRAKAGSANPARGEHTLTLAGTTYVMRPTYDAIVAIEDALDLTALELARAGAEGRLGCNVLGVIVAELVRAGAAPDDRLTANVTADALARLIYEEGRAKVGTVITVVLSGAVMGGHKATGEPKAVTEMPTG